MDINFNGIPVFKGLQKPLEFMGIRGRFLTYAAGAILDILELGEEAVKRLFLV